VAVAVVRGQHSQPGIARRPSAMTISPYAGALQHMIASSPAHQRPSSQSGPSVPPNTTLALLRLQQPRLLLRCRQPAIVSRPPPTPSGPFTRTTSRDSDIACADRHTSDQARARTPGPHGPVVHVITTDDPSGIEL